MGPRGAGSDGYNCYCSLWRTTNNPAACQVVYTKQDAPNLVLKICANNFGIVAARKYKNEVGMKYTIENVDDKPVANQLTTSERYSP
jgi:hypothetical protein